MTDALVRALNRTGFQPIFLPSTGLTPPDLYNFTRRAGKPRLVRRGPFARYLPESVTLPVSRSTMADISHQRTSAKGLSASTEFLSQCLACLGITSVPRIDLSFAGSSKLSFAFRGVWSLRVDPADIDHALEKLDLGAIPDEYVDRGFLHIAYEYAFATDLVLQREDGKNLNVAAEADIAAFITLGSAGKVQLDDRSTVSFAAADGADAPAFAYRAGRLVRDTRWRFYPEETYRSQGEAEQQPYVLRRGLVLDAEDDAGSTAPGR
jgi:hypothetical protein